MTNLITGIIGIAGMGVFLGILLWWIREPPLVIIAVFVMVLLVYDFVRTLIYGENGSGRDQT